MDTSTRLSGAKTRDDFLNKAHEARQARELARKQEWAANIIQAHMRSYHARHKLKKEALEEFKTIVSSVGNDTDIAKLQTILSKIIVLYRNSRDHVDIMKILLKALVLEPSTPVNLTQCSSINLFQSILCDCNRNDQSKEKWLRILEYLISFTLDRISECDITNPNDVHSLALYLMIVNQLVVSANLSATAPHAEEITGDADVKVKVSSSMTNSSTLNSETIGHELSNRTAPKREEIFSKLSESIFKLIKGPKTDLKTTILNWYIRLFVGLLKLPNSSWCQKSQNVVAPLLTSPAQRDQHKAELVAKLLSIPGLINFICQSSSRGILLELFEEIRLFEVAIELLNTNDQTLQRLTSTPALCILANLIHLGSLNEHKLDQELLQFVVLVTKLSELCQRNTKQKPASQTVEHSSRVNKKAADSTDESYSHILGWLTRETAPAIDQETSRMLKDQLSHLWSAKLLRILFNGLIEANEQHANETGSIKKLSTTKQSSDKRTFNGATQLLSKNIASNDTTHCQRQQSSQGASVQSMLGLRRALERAASSMSKSLNSSYIKTTGSHLGGNSGGGGLHSGGGNARLMTEEARRIALVCLMLNTALKTLKMIRQDILTGLCLHDYILSNLWTFISSLGAHNGLKAFLDHLIIHTKSNTPEFHILMLFCECASHIISILDDSELYEQQKPFTLEDLISISQFLNKFVFRLISNQLVAFSAHDGMDPILQTTHKLLTDLYKRDCRRNFSPPEHWLMSKELKMSLFIKDLEQGKPVAKAIMMLMPHIIPHKWRMVFFRQMVARDKAQYCTGFSTFITIHRSRLVEDGYQQLARLPPNALKGLIRVKFINDHGLDEAGIDQDGVFKEFLEDTIKRVFDPALNLFSSTSEQRLYPSPTSRLHEDHLSLFNFVGKMLGKAVYEGIVVDVPFASFFLSRVLGQPQSPLYSPIDELPSLDPELYKSLTYIKHYEGDVSELDLTFSLDQDFMGKIETYELEPGGKFLPVSKETRVRYIHSVANFRMKTQIEEQTEAFVRGFKSIVNLEWLSMFSSSEFQRLISGDTAPIDLQDLRKHTKYFGGFHNGHRVVSWLWDILDKDFTPEEHRLFLKFVTSCSKPPLFGFANLEPPFSIRCVEVSDDQDLGDTVGSVLRGFFAIRRSDPVDRLPTSSTCFNLLKLPNYQRRSTLREKLRYAIRNSSGFELS